MLGQLKVEMNPRRGDYGAGWSVTNQQHMCHLCCFHPFTGRAGAMLAPVRFLTHCVAAGAVYHKGIPYATWP